MASLPKCKPCNGSGILPFLCESYPDKLTSPVLPSSASNHCYICQGNGIDQKILLSKKQAVLYWSERMGLNNFEVIKLALEYRRIVSQPFEYEKDLRTNNELLETAYLNVIIDPEGRR